MDVNNDGQITKSDLLKNYRSISKISIDSVEVEYIIRQADFNGNGAIDYTDWLAVSNCWGEMLTEKKLRMAFNYFAEDGLIKAEKL